MYPFAVQFKNNISVFINRFNCSQQPRRSKKNSNPRQKLVCYAYRTKSQLKTRFPSLLFRLGDICWHLASPNKQKRYNCEDENHDRFKDCRWRRVTSLFFQLPYHIDAINRQATWWVSRFLRKERWFKRSSCFQNRSSIHKRFATEILMYLKIILFQEWLHRLMFNGLAQTSNLSRNKST